MLKAHLDLNADKAQIEFTGGLSEALSAVTFIVKDLYDHISEMNPSAGELFKVMFQCAIEGEDSPVWDKHESKHDGIKKVEIRFPDNYSPGGDL